MAGNLTSARPHTKAVWPLLLILAALATTILVLHLDGRPWWCACGSWNPWSGDVHSAHNSQHLFDPYSFTHVLHGFVLCGLLVLALPRWPVLHQFAMAFVAECLWEIVENTDFVINKYRHETMALGYFGDSVSNSIGDITSCMVGFLLARRLGWKWAILLTLLIEGIMLVWIRDSLLLNVLMLIYPFDAIKYWQLNGS